MNTSTTQGRSLHAETGRRRRSCFVAKREVEETNLGMWMTKKREEDNTTSDLYSPGGEIRCMGRPVEICPGHRLLTLGFVKRASLARDLDGGSRRISYSDSNGPNWSKPRSTPFAPKHSSTTFIVFANLSQISPSQSSHSSYCPAHPNISPCRYLLRRFPMSQPTVIPVTQPPQQH
jgi:hypothetical protein